MVIVSERALLAEFRAIERARHDDVVADLAGVVAEQEALKARVAELHDDELMADVAEREAHEVRLIELEAGRAKLAEAMRRLGVNRP
jgi:hypothetical protein